MTWRSEPLRNGLGAYQADWDALNRRYYQGHPFSDSRFIDGLLRYWATGRERLCIDEVGGRIEGLLILVPVRLGVWRQFAPSQLQGAPALLRNADDLNDVFACLPGPVWAIELMAQDPLYAPARLFDGNPRCRAIPYALTINVALKGNFEGYCRARPNKINQNLRRYERKALEQCGELRLTRITHPDEIAGAVDRYGILESSGWKGKEGTSLHPGNSQGKFYAEAMVGFARSGQAEVMELWIDNHLAASRLVISGQDIAVTLKTTFDENLAQVAPGRLLLNRLLQVFFEEQKFASVEFYTNATQDQLAWATGQRNMSHVMWFRSPTLAQLHDAIHKLRNLRKKSEATTPTTAQPLAADRFDSLDACPDDVLSLIASKEMESFDLSAAWFRLLIGTALPGDAKPCVYVLRRNGTAIGVLPLLARKKLVTGLTTFYSSLYRPVLAEGVDSRDVGWLLRRVVRDLQPARVIFTPLEPEHGSFDLLRRAMRQAGLVSFPFFASGNWYMPCPGMSYAEFLDRVPSRIRNTLKRKGKKFFQDGRGKIVLYTGRKEDSDPLDRAIEAWTAIYNVSWKVPEPYPDFMPGLIRLYAGEQTLRLAVAVYDDVPIAAQIWLVHGKKAAIYKLAYVEQYAELSAGTILSAHLFKQVLDSDRVEEVDYLVGDDPYKKDWVSHRRERWGVVAYDPRKWNGLLGLIKESAGRFVRRL